LNLVSQQFPAEVDIVASPARAASDDEEQQGGVLVEAALVEDGADAGNESDTEEQQSIDPLTLSLLQASSQENSTDELIDEGIKLIDPSDDGLSEDPSEFNNNRKRRSQSIEKDPNKRQRILASMQDSVKRVSFRTHPSLGSDNGQPRPS
jgi:DNA polymerase zeta